MKKINDNVVVWIVRVYQGINGWKDFKVCYSPAEADKVIYDICKKQGVPCADFNVIRKAI